MQNPNRAFFIIVLGFFMGFAGCAHSAASVSEGRGKGVSIKPAQIKNGALAVLDFFPAQNEEYEWVQGKFESHEIKFYYLKDKKQWQGLLGLNYYQKAGSFEVVITSKQRDKELIKETVKFSVKDGDYKRETLTVDPKHSKPSAKNLKRIKRESAEIGAVYRNSINERLWEGSFLLPIDSPPTSLYGNKRLYNGDLQSYHAGLDLKAAVGTPIAATAKGKVVYSKDLFLTGHTVILDHGLGLFSVYAHMSQVDVHLNSIVDKGKVLGLSGATGRVSGPHLHWSIVLGSNKVDPQGALDFLR